jgi:hypothetical protein
MVADSQTAKCGLKYDIYTSSRTVRNMDNNAVNAPRFFAFGIKKWAAYFMKAALACNNQLAG